MLMKKVTMIIWYGSPARFLDIKWARVQIDKWWDCFGQQGVSQQKIIGLGHSYIPEQALMVLQGMFRNNPDTP